MSSPPCENPAVRPSSIAWLLVAAAACRPGPKADAANADADAHAKSDAGVRADAERDAKGDASADAEVVVTDWCIEGMRALDEDVCYVLPPLAAGQPRQLLVYLHGIVPPVPVSVRCSP